jgi:DNA-binding NarL/FixJ family response regulator
MHEDEFSRGATTMDQSVLVRPLDAAGQRLRVLVVHGNALIRRGLRGIIADQGDIVVVAEAADGREAAQLVRALGIEGLDVALVDVGARRSWASAADGLGVVTVVFSVSALRSGRFRGVRIGTDGRLGKHLAAPAVAQALRLAQRNV